jgi:uncharacterized protein YjeT (DUF2065 family)
MIMGMEIVVKILGIIIIFLGIGYLLKPDIIKLLMEFFKKGKRVYFVAVLRFVLAIIFLLGASGCDQKWIIAAFGVIFMISGLLILILGPEKIRLIFDWYQNQPVLLFRIIAAIVLACGAVIIYAA